jgi:hypothetical protein
MKHLLNLIHIVIGLPTVIIAIIIIGTLSFLFTGTKEAKKDVLYF